MTRTIHVGRDHMQPSAESHGNQRLEQSVSVRVPARIVVDAPRTEKPSYCWRENWLTGYDSIFAVLSKFSSLNGLTARDIGALFISAKSGRKGTLVRQLNIDLRDPSIFDLPKISRLCGTTVETIASGFVLGRFAASPIESTDTLRFCADCLSRGFHSPLFQLKFIPRCPIHQLPLRHSCTHCGGIVPYRLTSAMLKEPFSCPYCRTDLALELRKPRAANIRLAVDECARLGNAIEVASMKSRLFGSTPHLDRHASLFGLGRSVVSAASTQRDRQDYYDFIDDLVRRICPELPSSSESPAAITEIVRGHYDFRPRIQSRALRRRRRGTSRGRYALDEADVAVPRSEHGADASVSFPRDGKLRAIYPTYCALRRRVWCTHVADHRFCTFSAATRIWWDVEGEGLATFCPMAAAYLRWRMFWEGVRVPADLFRAPRHAPFGVLAWLCDGAPIGAEQWTQQGEQWLAHRVFAMDCIRNFYEWLTLSMSIPRTSSTRWLRAAAGGYCLTHWAAAGNDSSSVPLRVFLDVAAENARIPVEATSLGAHRQWHAGQLLKIRR